MSRMAAPAGGHPDRLMPVLLRSAGGPRAGLPHRPPAAHPRHDRVAGDAVLDRIPILALTERPPGRPHLDAQRRPARRLRLQPRILLLRQRARRAPHHDGERRGENRQPDAHGFSSVRTPGRRGPPPVPAPKFPNMAPPSTPH